MSGALMALETQTSDSDSRNILATAGLNGEVTISQGELSALLSTLSPEQLQVLKELPSARDNLVSDFMMRRLIANKAQIEGFEKKSDVINTLAISYVKIVSDMYLKSRESAALDANKLERLAKDEYRAFPERYRIEERHARHILIKSTPSCQKNPNEIAFQILDRLKSGEPFEELARSLSDDTGSAERGGDLGWVKKGKTVKPFDSALFSMKAPGLLPEPIESDFGLHVIQLVEIKPPKMESYENVRASIIESIKARLQKDMRTEFVDSVKSDGNIKIDSDKLNEIINEAKRQ